MVRKFQVLLAVCAFLSMSIKANMLDIYYQNGNVETIEHDEHNLPPDLVSTICNQGVWTIYSTPNYTSDGVTQVLYKLNGHCEPPSVKTVRSARAVGYGIIPSLTLFSDVDLSGAVEITTSGSPSLKFPVIGFIGVNAENAEFFKKENYEGDSFCVWMYGGTDWYWSWRQVNAPWDGSLARSARLGCFQTESINANNSERAYRDSERAYPDSISKIEK